MNAIDNIRREIRELEANHEELRELGRLYPSTYGDIQPAREVIRLRLVTLREQEAGFLKMGGDVHRQNRQHATVHPEPPSWKVGAMLIIAMVCLTLAYLLYAAGALS